MDKIKFEKHTGKKAEVRILSETKVAEGSWGDIYEALVDIAGRERKFIIKKYGKKGSATQLASQAFEKYKKGKEAGLRVFPTFRLSGDRKSILMTNGSLEDKICLGSNTYVGMEKKGFPRIKKIDNLDEFLDRLFDEVIKAGKVGCALYLDVPFFTVTKSEPIIVDFYLGDMDNFNFEPILDAESVRSRTYIGVHGIQDALFEFCELNIDPEYSDTFLDKVAKKCQELEKEFRKKAK